MAIVSMQKVAVLSLISQQEPLLQLLHEEGVLEISDARESSNVDHTEVNFRIADLEYAIASLKGVATKKILSAMKKAEADHVPQQVIYAAHNTDVMAIVERLHAMEDEDRKLEAMAAGKRVIEHSLAGGGAEQPVFLSSGGNDDVAKVGGEAGDVSSSPELMEARAKAQKQLDRNAAARLKLAEELPNLALLRVFLQWLGQKQAAREAMKKTKTTVMLQGWIPENRFVHLQVALKHKLPDAAIVPLAADDAETPPVELKNNPLLTPFESVTKLYGLPQYHEMDPTPYLSLFFILFFALCLTDAGYGAVQALITGAVLLKMKPKVQDQPLLWLLFISGIVTVLVSIPFGGWFGMTPQQAPAFMTETRADGVMWFKGQIWNLGEQKGISFLQNLALALGVVHLTFGIVLSAFWKMRNRQYAAAFWQDVSTLAMIGSLVFSFLGPVEYKQYATYAIYASVAFMIWGKGYGSSLAKRPFMGLLQTLNWFLGMLGNVLSYLRILALGLVTGALAFTVNLVAEQIGALLPWFLVIPFMITVYIVGHTMNIALNVLGAFIHSGRLQFVEFFSQFFEGGGRPFKPFTRS